MAKENTSEQADKQKIDFDPLEKQLIALQQKIREQKIPVVLVLSGWDSAGKGTLLSKLMAGLDPRGYKVYNLQDEPLDNDYPLMRRYWVCMPKQGNISIFNGSWYREVAQAAFEQELSAAELDARYREIVQMESQLLCSGATIIKLFLHVSRKEQRKRQEAAMEKKSTRWRVTKADLKQNKNYEEYLQLYDEMMERTQQTGAMWHVLPTDSKQECAKKAYDIVLTAFEQALKSREGDQKPWDVPALPMVDPVPLAPIGELSSYSLALPPVEDYKVQLDKAQKKLRKLQDELYRKHIPLVAGFEGWDAAGKGGAIRRLTAALDPRSYEVVPISSPTPDEKAHHHLWRFWTTLPEDGHITIYDRTWYGRVMVERIEGFCSQNDWMRAYEEINQFEKSLTEHGVIVRKFWLQIDQQEQLTRFQARQNDPEKQWKITDEDWRNREKWPQYEVAVNEMLQKTNTEAAPWTVVEANSKEYARLKVLNTLISAIEERLKQD